MRAAVTDTMPLSPQSKLLMAIEASVKLVANFHFGSEADLRSLPGSGHSEGPKRVVCGHCDLTPNRPPVDQRNGGIIRPLLAADLAH
jgi:hypothetical protein